MAAFRPMHPMHGAAGCSLRCLPPLVSGRHSTSFTSSGQLRASQLPAWVKPAAAAGSGHAAITTLAGSASSERSSSDSSGEGSSSNRGGPASSSNSGSANGNARRTAVRQSRPAPTPEQVAIKRAAKSAQLSGQLHHALALLQQGLQKFPEDAQLAVAAATIHSKLGRHAQAVSVLEAALDADPRSSHLATALATAYGRAGDAGAARTLFQRAVAASPKNPIILQSWGVMEAAAGQHDAARDLFASAAAAQPLHVPTYTAWARLEAQLGRTRPARRLFRQGAEANARNAPNLLVGGCMPPGLQVAGGKWLHVVGVGGGGGTQRPGWGAAVAAHCVLSCSLVCSLADAAARPAGLGRV